MLICGLDPASVRCGYAILDVGRATPHLVECGVLEAPRTAGKYLRLAEIMGDVGKLLDEYRPNVVALEDGFVPSESRRKGALTLDGARAVCGVAAAQRGIPVFEYAPATVKKCATGNGRASKEQVIALVTARLKLAKPPQSDAADAIAVAIAHYQIAGVPAQPRPRGRACPPPR